MTAAYRGHPSFNMSPSSATQLSWPSVSVPLGAAGPSGSLHRASHPETLMASGSDDRGRKRTSTLPSSMGMNRPFYGQGAADQAGLDLLSDDSSGSLPTSPLQSSESTLTDDEFPSWMQQSQQGAISGWQTNLLPGSFQSGNPFGGVAPALATTQSLTMPQHPWQAPGSTLSDELHLRTMQDEMEIRRRNSASDARLSYSTHGLSPSSAAAAGLPIVQQQREAMDDQQQRAQFLNLPPQYPQSQQSSTEMAYHPEQNPYTSFSLASGSSLADYHQAAALQQSSSPSVIASGLSTGWQGSQYGAADGQRDHRSALHPSASSPNLSGPRFTATIPSQSGGIDDNRSAAGRGGASNISTSTSPYLQEKSLSYSSAPRRPPLETQGSHSSQPAQSTSAMFFQSPEHFASAAFPYSQSQGANPSGGSGSSTGAGKGGEMMLRMSATPEGPTWPSVGAASGEATAQALDGRADSSHQENIPELLSLSGGDVLPGAQQGIAAAASQSSGEGTRAVEANVATPRLPGDDPNITPLANAEGGAPDGFLQGAGSPLRWINFQ